MIDANEINNELDGNKLEAIEQDGFLEIVVNSQAFLRDEAKEFQTLTGEAVLQGLTKFLINFNDCQYISSEGLGCIAEFWRKCSENEEHEMVSLFNKKSVNELLNFFEIIGLARVMKGYIFTDYTKAKNFIMKK